jgi:hypothetical protein
MSGAAITGGVLALTGTLLLLIGSSLPLAEARGLFGGVAAVTFWDDLEAPG